MVPHSTSSRSPHVSIRSRRPVVALISLYDFENNALRQLAPGLRARGVRVLEIYFKDWRNNAFRKPKARELGLLRELLDTHGVDLVGLSLRASAYEGFARELTARLRRAGRTVIAGGWHVTVRPEDCLTFADAVCLGEADSALPELVERYFGGGDWRASPGFWVRAPGDGHRVNPPAALVYDLDQLPRRDYGHADKVVIEDGRAVWRDPMRRDPLFQIAASIGCIQRCAFCHNSHDSPYLVPRGTLRKRSVGSVLEEIASNRARNPAIRRVRFDDEIFGLDLAWLEEFAQRYPAECGLPFDVLSEPRVVTERYARLLAKAGAKVLHLGIQHDDDVSRTLLARRASGEQTQQAVARLTAEGIFIRYLVMVDIPGVTDEQHARLLEFLLEVPRPFDLYLFSLTLFPGSAMVEEQLARGELQPSQVEGRATKTFSQYRADLGYPRPPREQFWLALLVLASNPFVPPDFVRRAMHSAAARAHPRALVELAGALGLAKTARLALAMARSGEITPTMLRRWLTLKRWITT